MVAFRRVVVVPGCWDAGGGDAGAPDRGSLATRHTYLAINSGPKSMGLFWDFFWTMDISGLSLWSGYSSFFNFESLSTIIELDTQNVFYKECFFRYRYSAKKNRKMIYRFKTHQIIV